MVLPVSGQLSVPAQAPNVENLFVLLQDDFSKKLM